MKKVLIFLIVLSLLLFSCLDNNKSKDLVIGTWSLYLDAPNVLFVFSEDQSAKMVFVSTREDDTIDPGEYEVNDQTISALFSDYGELTLELVEDENGEPKIKWTGEDQDYFFFKVDEEYAY